MSTLFSLMDDGRFLVAAERFGSWVGRLAAEAGACAAGNDGCVFLSQLQLPQTVKMQQRRFRGQSGREERQSEPGLSEVGTKGASSQCLRTSLRRRTACFGLSHESS